MTIENEYHALHQTVGINLYVTSERMILLDVQPIFSSSVLTQMIKNEVKLPLSSDMQSFENLHDIQARHLYGIYYNNIDLYDSLYNW